MEDRTRVGKPLFTIDLGGNGGILEPVDYPQLKTWLTKEIDFWKTIEAEKLPRSTSGIAEDYEGLLEASFLSGPVADLEKQSNLRRNIFGVEDDAERIQFLIKRIYLSDAGKKPLPHSSSSTAKAIDLVREKHGIGAARYFALLQVPSEHSPPYPKSMEDWYGVFAGLMLIEEKFSVADLSIAAHRLAFDELRGEVARLFEGSAQRLAQMQQDHQIWVEQSRIVVDECAATFDSSQMTRDQKHAAMLSIHEEKMTHIRDTFRNEFALHAPAEYWKTKSQVHRRATWFLGALSFVSIFASAWFVGTNVHDILSNTERGAFPETWRLGLLAVLGVFSVWAVRLIVRMFLSHLHLAGDAEERVVMLKTYLSLMQDGKTNSTEDRQLILQALFRPASDGIVKDEGVPTSVFELLTRASK